MATKQTDGLRQKMQEALQLHQTGEIEKAQRLYKSVLKKTPNNADALHLLGVTYRQNGDARRAFDTILKAIKISPNQATFYANLARTMVDMPDTAPDSILAVTQKALSLDPKHKQARSLLGVCYSNLDRQDEAEEIFQSLIVEDPDFAEAYENYGHLMRQKKDNKKAFVFFSKCILLNPNNANAYVQRARCRLELKEYEESEYELSEALRRFPDHGDVLHEVARLMFSESKSHTGLPYAERAVQENPKDYHRHVTLGVTKLMLGDAQGALDSFLNAKRVAPPDAKGIEWNMSLAYLSLGDLENGWDLHPERFDDPKSGVNHRYFDVPAWEGEDISDKTVLVWTDQGLGDALKAGAMIPELEARAKKVIFEVSKKSEAYFQHSFPNVLVRPAEFDKNKKALRSDFEVHANITDLARFFRRSLKDFSDTPHPVYRFVQEKARQLLGKIGDIGDRKIVGISWRSKNLSVNRARYYMSAPEICRVIEGIDDAVFVNLQYLAVQKEIDFFKHKLPGAFFDFGDEVDLFDDILGAANVTAICDIVLSANTSAAEISGGLDVPTIRFGGHEAPLLCGQPSPPWYPSMSYMIVEEDKPSSALTPRLRQELLRELETTSIERRMRRLGFAD
ncbi:tetratricopeptide (TPR) repeat protein [Roseibium hamelinense]|uniref:Tetratricopeptide (TPR) repeat protein n=1 Tax=Roseibium hamelinense TaxID=150831 RepID=A0A562T9Z2_9HYPH|nr:tetratricopeptide repeat protein [Roseibium hamelinense]MTI43556.1 tetratricopeptide repeat protein [Roseibium hamelinense]TWI89650.1 tetratricopeptide (TPR) repeat protein [Roseibium hamelinense]